MLCFLFVPFPFTYLVVNFIYADSFLLFFLVIFKRLTGCFFHMQPIQKVMGH